MLEYLHRNPRNWCKISTNWTPFSTKTLFVVVTCWVYWTQYIFKSQLRHSTRSWEDEKVNCGETSYAIVSRLAVQQIVYSTMRECERSSEISCDKYETKNIRHLSQWTLLAGLYILGIFSIQDVKNFVTFILTVDTFHIEVKMFYINVSCWFHKTLRKSAMSEFFKF